MSIVACVKTQGGVVLGADSMTTVSAPGPDGLPMALKTYSHAHKVFQFANLPIGVLTWGLGNIGNRSIGSYIFEASQQVADLSVTVKSAASMLYSTFASAYNNEFAAVEQLEKPWIGIYVAGYDPHEPLPLECEFALPNDKEPREVRDRSTFGAAWRGMDGIFSRLYFGLDPRISTALPPNVAPSLAEFEMRAIFDTMPLQDAVDFAQFILQTTIGFSRFDIGAPAAGGPIEMATITETGKPDERFSWVSRTCNYI
jgi:hypothetical protein